MAKVTDDERKVVLDMLAGFKAKGSKEMVFHIPDGLSPPITGRQLVRHLEKETALGKVMLEQFVETAREDGLLPVAKTKTKRKR